MGLQRHKVVSHSVDAMDKESPGPYGLSPGSQVEAVSIPVSSAASSSPQAGMSMHLSSKRLDSDRISIFFFILFRYVMSGAPLDFPTGRCNLLDEPPFI